MQIVIDIPEDIRINITRMGLLRIPNEQIRVVDSAIQHGTVLPEKAWATEADILEREDKE